MRFASETYFYWLFVVIGLFVSLFFYDQWLKSKTQKQFSENLWAVLTQSLSLQKRWFKWFLQFLALVLIIVSLARPQYGESQQEVKSQGFELMLMIDVSESMLAEDVKPNRLEQAKLEMEKLVDLMPGNKVGIIAFAGSAALLCPLTNDPNAIKMYIESLTTESVSSQGTSFEEALKTAESAFERGGLGDEGAVTRVILLASDGEDHDPGAEAAARKLVEKGIRIFSLAYGTEKGGTIPQRDQFGYLKEFKKDRQGQPVLTTVKGAALKALAEEGKGSFYFANFGGRHLESLVEDFQKLEKTEFSSQLATQYDERFQWPLFLAMMIVLIEIFLGERRSGFSLWRGRYEKPL